MRRAAAVILALAALLVLIRTEGFGVDFNDLLFSGADAHYRGDLSTAAAAFEAALRMEPGNSFARNQLGLVYAKQHEFNRAMDQFQQVAAMESDNTFARLWIGILYLQEGDLDRAFGSFTELLAIDEKNADACYFVGTIYYVRRNLPEAIRYLKRARDADSQEPETHYRLARLKHMYLFFS